MSTASNVMRHDSHVRYDVEHGIYQNPAKSIEPFFLQLNFVPFLVCICGMARK